jgi:acyl carrier protein
MITMQELKQLMTDVVKGLDLTHIDGEKTFTDVGLDSLDHVAFLLAVDEKYGVNIPDEDINLCYSLDSTVTYLNKNEA